MIASAQSGEIVFGSGGAIIAESDPEEEYREILVKAYALLRAVYLAKFGAFETYRIVAGDTLTDNNAFNQQHFPSPDYEKIFKIHEPVF